MIASDVVYPETTASQTYHNDDGVVARVSNSDQELMELRFIITKGSNVSELLVKLDQTKLDDFLSSESLTEWEDGAGRLGVPFGALGGVLNGVNSPNQSSAFYKSLPVETNLRPGHVICLASSTPTGVFRNENQEPLVEYPQNLAKYAGYSEHVEGNTSSVIEGVFETATNGEYLQFNDFGTKVNIKQNKWATFMFTGIRWVLLGSNNWVS